MHAQYFKIGLFVLAGIGLALGAVLLFGASRLFQERVIMETYIDESVQGLDVGSPIKHRGVRVGNVESIEFVSGVYRPKSKSRKHLDLMGRYVLVRFALRPGVFTGGQGDMWEILGQLIEQGLRVRLASQGLTGTAYLEVDYLDPARNPPLAIAWEPKYYHIPSAPSTITRFSNSLERVMQRVDQSNLEEIVTHLDQLLIVAKEAIEDANVAKLQVQLEALMKEGAATTAAAGELLSGKMIPDTMAALDQAAERVDQAATRLDSLLANQALQQILANGEHLSRELQQAAEGLPAILGRLQRVLRRVDTLVARQERNIDLSMDNIRVITTHLRTLSSELEQQPSRLLFSAPPPVPEAALP